MGFKISCDIKLTKPENPWDSLAQLLAMQIFPKPFSYSFFLSKFIYHGYRQRFWRLRPCEDIVIANTKEFSYISCHWVVEFLVFTKNCLESLTFPSYRFFKLRQSMLGVGVSWVQDPPLMPVINYGILDKWTIYFVYLNIPCFKWSWWFTVPNHQVFSCYYKRR